MAIWVLMFLLGIIALKTARSALDRRPQIVLTPSGFYWRKWSEVEIPWSEIVKIGIKRRGNYEKYITLKLRDRARYRADSLITRCITWINEIYGLGDIAISRDGLNRKPQEILEAMRRFRKAAA